jgi:hypothetical protein
VVTDNQMIVSEIKSRAVNTIRAGVALFTMALLMAIPLGRTAGAPTVTPGSPEAANAYYIRISKLLSFDASPGSTRLESLLDYLGYPASGVRLKDLDPQVLMTPGLVVAPDGLDLARLDPSRAPPGPDDILATRFFAPKITNVNTSEPKPGWRKLVRLHARSDSRAAKAGVESAMILFNFFAPVGQPPFVGNSINTQVMLLVPKLPERLIWLDFDSNGVLGLLLQASFDALSVPDTGLQNYYVPDGCNDCHGSPGNARPPMVNYLDTDHWFDRLENDFSALKATSSAVVFDAQTNDTTQPAFARAFDVIRRFNAEALAQDNVVQPESFETAAARTWLTLHAHSDAHIAPVDRAFSLDGSPKWQSEEAPVLGTLDRFCFRCHGSVRFSAFERQAVVERAGRIQQRLRPSEQQAKIPGFRMPPDRPIDEADLQIIENFLNHLP